MTSNARIDYLELPAADLDAVERFYSAVFQWQFTDYGPEYRAFNDGRLDGGFYRSDRVSLTDNGAALIVFYTEDLEGMQTRIEAQGGEIILPTFAFPGGRRFQFADPHGNELAVWTDKPEPGT